MELTLEEKVEKNKEWIEIAKGCGLFKNGYDKKNIITSDDYVIIHWIDELDKTILDEDTFRNEIIPAFKRWFNNGVRTTGVGRFYNIISLCEIKIRELGWKINPAWVDSIINFFNKDIVSIPVSSEEFSEYCAANEKIDKIITFVSAGIVYTDFDQHFDILEYLYENGKKVDFNTALFFADSPAYSLNETPRSIFNKKKLSFDNREFIGEEYGYLPQTAFEADTLVNMASVGIDYPFGHNFQHVEILKRKIEETKKGMANRIFHRYQGNKKGKLVKITYYELFDGKEIENNIIGELIDFNDKEIVVKDIDGKQIKLENSDTLHIFKIKGSSKKINEFSQNLKKLQTELESINRECDEQYKKAMSQQGNYVFKLGKPTQLNSEGLYSFEIDSMKPNDGLGYPPYAKVVRKKEQKEKEIERFMKSFDHQIYHSNDLIKWRKVVEYNKKIDAIKGRNVLEEYVNRFNTLEGLAFLKTKDSLFFRMVHPIQFPIDNLFAACFECLAYDTDNKAEQQQILKRVWVAYEILSEKKLKWLKNCNYGGDLKHALLNSTLEAVERVCQYVRANKLEKELPPEPEGMGFNGMQPLTLEQIKKGMSISKVQLDRDAQMMYLKAFNKILQLLPKELIEGVDEDLLLDLVGALLDSLSDEEWMQIYDGKVAEELMQVLLERLSAMIIGHQQGKGRGGK